jgi:hypothetical protein
MPIHDWTRVSAGIFHDFHVAWIVSIQKILNTEILPPTHYAQIEQTHGSFDTEYFEPGPDLILEPGDLSFTESQPPITRYTTTAEFDPYLLKRRTVVIRHSSGDRIIALIEIVSPGNKAARHALRSFVEKAVEALYHGYHLLIVDLFPPGPRDPQGIHGAIWSEFSDAQFELPRGEPLTLAAYSAGPIKNAYIEPAAVGREMIDMPLFLEPETYVNVPLEATYQAAYRGVPQRWKRVLEA